MASLKNFTEKLVEWNRDTFGNIFWRKKKLNRQMEGVSKAMETRLTVGLLKLERNLKREWAYLLLQEELLWLQKSRIDWLRLGDRNTRFFHISTVVRRRRNMVEMLKREDGQWEDDMEKLKNMAV